jgi:hypothetical protein
VISIQKSSVEKALDQIDRLKMPSNRRSHIFCLITRKRHYAPKYVLYLAHKIETGKPLKGLKGGPHTNDQLTALGYSVPPKKCSLRPHCQDHSSNKLTRESALTSCLRCDLTCTALIGVHATIPGGMSTKPYNIFISWSGDRSKHIALGLRDWLPAILQTCKTLDVRI